MIIAVDFDGTCVTHDFPRIGQDIGAAPVLRELVANGHKLILNTMRSNRPVCDPLDGITDGILDLHGDFLDEAVEWFALNHIELYGIQRNPTQDAWTTSPKCYAHLYIDDAALGCPLAHPAVGRPYVDWFGVRSMLVELGLLLNK